VAGAEGGIIGFSQEGYMSFTKTIGSVVASGVALMAAATAVQAQDINPAVIFDLGGKFDRSFNQASFTGAERFKEETGIEYREFELQSDAQREQALRRFAEQGNNPVIVTGFAYGSAMEAVASEFPDTSFVIIDMVVDKPNVRSVVFNEHEGSYLVGVLAALASETGQVGFVGGMDIPLIQKFACGYVQGVKATNPDAVVYQNMTGTTGAAWNDPVRGGELAKSQIDRGADVVYHAAGGTGVGVLQAAADAGVFGIGVDSNQNYLHPGSVLTSMLKRVDVAVYDALMDAQNGEWTPGIVVMGLAEDGVGYALDEHNAALITDEMQAAAEEAKAKIIAGEITVHDYTTDGACPVQ
jgi:basic membrane protein A and related proteins